jgi:hypothetical protein
MGRTDEEKAAAKAATELGLAVAHVGGMRVRKDPLRIVAPRQMDVPVAGARVTIDRGEAAKRITATRVVALGPFALLAKKDATHLFITIEGADGSALVIECPAKKEGRARQLAALVHAKYGPPAAAATPTPEDTQPEG